MNESPRSSLRWPDLDLLRAAYPEWAIGRAADRRDPPRWEAVARHQDVRPTCLITTDLDELAHELAAACRRCLVCARWFGKADARISPDGTCPLGHPTGSECGQAHFYSVREPGPMPKRVPDRAAAVAALRRGGPDHAHAVATHRDGTTCRAKALAVECDAAAAPVPGEFLPPRPGMRLEPDAEDSRPIGPGERALREFRDDGIA